MKLSQLIAEATARLADLRARHGADADAEVFVSLKGDQEDVQDTELYRGIIDPTQWFFELKTQKDDAP